MNKKMSKRQRDIKTKLMAAVAMLLVSSIMMVSTTYAWFTLSTAPEVTGINTAVGANGNLEMALMPKAGPTGTDFGITSSAGDSTKSALEKNVTWGNLVDLAPVGNVDSYGLTKISLYPSALNAATEDADKNPLSLADLMLKTPTYGADGRVSELLANTVTSTYDTATQTFPQNSEYGVRAVGTASGMTDRQLAYRNARSTASTAMAQAKTLASQSLNTNGSRLADIALAHGVNANATHTQSDVTALLAIVNDLLGVDGEGGKTGVIEYIETAYLNYIIAYGASQAAVTAGLDDDEFKVFQSALTGAENVYAAAELCATNGVTLPDSVLTPLGELEGTRADVESAKTDLETIQGYGSSATITWGTAADGKIGISTPLYKLADTDAMEINGFAANTVKQNMSAIINSVASQGLNVVIASGGGVYADVADHCGDFNAAITIQKVEYNGLVLENMDAKMATETDLDVVYLSAVASAVDTAKAPENAGGQTMPITDMYGYIIDLAFRTNAADSNLQLQVAAMDRIYGEEGGDETMGSGSNMTFTSTTSGFTLDQMKSLMEAIRIVFFDPSTKSVLATGALDADNGTVTGGNTIKADMYLYEMKGTAGTRHEETKYVEAEAATTDYYVMNVTYTQVNGDASQVTEQLYVSDGNNGYVAAEYDADKTDVTYYTRSVAYASIDDAAAKESTDMLYKLVAYNAGLNKLNNTKITALTQNTATAVSVLVYLDGEAVSNKDVAATAATSMTGTMNLQFSSSALLEPMEYTPLMAQGKTFKVTLPAAGVEGEEKATEGKAYTFTVATGYTLGTVTVGGTTVTPTAGENGTYTIGADNVTGDIVINVTANGG